MEAVQRERTEDERFSTGAYEVNKELTLLNHPALSVEVWVDEVDGLAVTDAERLARELPGQVSWSRRTGCSPTAPSSG